MSTKIYDAYVRPKFESIQEFHDKVMEIGNKIKADIMEETLRKIGEHWSIYNDRHKLGRIKGEVRKEYYEFVSEIVDKIDAANKSISREEWDTRFKVLFFPHKDKIYMTKSL